VFFLPDIFRQLTLLEVSVFKAITPKDLFMKTAKRRSEKCQTLMRLITQFNNVTNRLAILCHGYLSELKPELGLTLSSFFSRPRFGWQRRFALAMS